MNKCLLWLSTIFLFGLNSYAQRSNERIITGKPGITIDYSYQKMNAFSIGPNFCIGTMKEKANGTSFFQFDVLYTGVLLKNNYYHGFKSGLTYSYVGGKGLGISSSLNYMRIMQNNLITPEIGFNFIGFINLNYGYTFSMLKSPINMHTSHKLGIRISLNRAYFLAFKMV